VKGRRRGVVAAAAAVALALPGCSTSSSGASSLRGQRIEVMAVWSGVEQARFERVIADFERRTGAVVAYTTAGHGVPAALGDRFAQGSPPDVAFLPQPGLLRRYATEGRLVRLDHVVGDVVAQNYAAVWRGLASSGGRLYGVWFKAANKSLIWYNVGAFERAGVVPPDDLADLVVTAQRLAASGLPAFSLGAASGWTLTDWFENLYLRVAGQAQYDRLAEHRIPWTDDSVKATLRLLDALLGPGTIAGGATGALQTDFEASVRQTFASPPAAAMTSEGDFVAGVITGETSAKLGVDADVFPFPRVDPPGRGVVGGGDVAVLLRQSPAGAAFVRYLATPAAAAIWAAQGGFLSPNLNLDPSTYPDEITRSLARGLLEAGDDFRFDLSDLQPPAFGGTEGQGMRGELQEFLRTRDVDTTAARLEADAKAAFGQ
jgi:ABC-type glycerol-3-phosphate transport system substrate-binding protein